MTGANSDEEAWFLFVVFQSKEHCDEVNKKMIEEMNEKYKDAKDFLMPCDMKRIACGGFQVEVEG